MWLPIGPTAFAKILNQKILRYLERWIKNYINNWAKCDTFCNHTVGAFVELYPEYLKDLKKWAKSGNRWFCALPR